MANKMENSDLVDNALMLVRNAITDALREIEKCPDDSIQDIFNEKFVSWNTGLFMDHNYNIERR